MAKALGQHRIVIVAPSDNVNTIREVDEEERSLSALDLSRTLPDECHSTYTGSLESFHSSLQCQSTPDIKRRVTLSEDIEYFDPDDSFKRDVMEHETVFPTSSPMCNGGPQAAVVKPTQFSPNFFSQRRATMAAYEGVGSYPTSPVHQLQGGEPPDPTSRGLSASLGSNREFNLALGTGSQDLFHNQAELPHDEEARRHHHLDTENKQHAKYGSTLTNIGVDIMKATGSMGVRFKQLQKPFSKSNDSLHRHSILPTPALSERRSSTIAGALCNDVPLMIPINNLHKSAADLSDNHRSGKHSSNRQNHHHNHAGYRLGQRKTLAEHRRKVADYSCLFALTGLVLMIVEMELTIASIGNFWYAKVSSF